MQIAHSSKKQRLFTVLFFLVYVLLWFRLPSLSSPKKANPTATNATARMPIHIKTPGTPCVSRFTKK
jgi:hypothetical protein